jgi:hypothetical protein
LTYPTPLYNELNYEGLEGLAQLRRNRDLPPATDE